MAAQLGVGEGGVAQWSVSVRIDMWDRTKGIDMQDRAKGFTWGWRPPRRGSGSPGWTQWLCGGGPPERDRSIDQEGVPYR